MKKNFYPVISALLILFWMACTTVVFGHASGAPAGATGSPGDGHSCTSCHGGTATAVSGYFSTNIPGSGYVAGNTYTITVSFSGSGGKGFEVSPQNVSGTQLGTLIAGTGNKLVSGSKYCTQSSSVSSTPATWTFTGTAPAAGTGNVTFYGAFAITEGTTHTESITVSEDQPVSVVATANPMMILTGSSSQLGATASGGSGSYTYSWTSIPAGYTSNLQNPTVAPTTTTSYVAHANDGTNTATNTVQVTVVQNNLSATATATPSTVSLGQSSQLNAIVSGGSGSYSFLWVSNPVGFTSTLQNPLVTPAVSTQYTCTVNDGFQNANSSINVTVNASTLVVVVSGTPTSLCSGSPTQLNANAAGGSGSYTYTWTSVPAGFTSTIQNPTASPTVSTKYFAVVNDGFKSVKDSVLITVQAAPSPVAGNDTLVCVAVTQIPLNGTSSNSASVLWTTSGDGTFSSTTNPQSIYFPGTGDKTSLHANLTLTANAIVPCTNAATSIKHITFDPCGGVAAVSGDELSFSLWPNPSAGRLTITVKRPDPSPAILRIYDLNGTKRYQEQFDLQDLTITRTLNLDNLPSGIYVVKIECNNTIRVQKLVIL